MKHPGGRPVEWSLWRVRRKLRAMVDELQAEKKVRGNPDAFTITFQTLLTRHGLYPDIIQYWVSRYPDDEEIFRAIKTMRAIFESRIVDGAMRKQLDPIFSMFNLKNNYTWKDDPDAARRDESRLTLEVAEVRARLAEEVHDIRALPHGNSSHTPAT